MTTEASDLLSTAMSLPEGDRATIAYGLLQSLKPIAGVSGSDPSSLAEIERRSAEMDRDPSIGIPAEEVDRLIRQDLEKRRKS
jgi:putative addiction module component (TIGR02574 family)